MRIRLTNVLGQKPHVTNNPKNKLKQSMQDGTPLLYFTLMHF